MQKFLFLLFFSCTVTKVTQAQSVSTQMGARVAGVGNVGVAFSDAWAIFNNVAGLAGMNVPMAAFAYDLRPLLPGADRMAAAAGMPTRMGTFGASVFRFGDDLYSEQLLSMAFANRFGLASIGIKVSYVQYRAEGFGTQSAVSIGFGGLAELGPRLQVGAYIQNLNQPELGKNSDRLAAWMAAGVSYQATEKLVLLGELSKDIDFDATVKAGMEYEIVTNIRLRTGFNIHPQIACGGFGYQAGRLGIDYSIQYNRALGPAHQFSANWKLSQKAE